MKSIFETRARTMTAFYIVPVLIKFEINTLIVLSTVRIGKHTQHGLLRMTISRYLSKSCFVSPVYSLGAIDWSLKVNKLHKQWKRFTFFLWFLFMVLRPSTVKFVFSFLTSFTKTSIAAPLTFCFLSDVILWTCQQVIGKQM